MFIINETDLTTHMFVICVLTLSILCITSLPKYRLDYSVVNKLVNSPLNVDPQLLEQISLARNGEISDALAQRVTL